jgi:hypothetical protein
MGCEKKGLGESEVAEGKQLMWAISQFAVFTFFIKTIEYIKKVALVGHLVYKVNGSIGLFVKIKGG